MKNGNLGGFLGGLVGLAVSIYIIGYAWRVSQTSTVRVASVSKDGDDPTPFDGVYS
jgi:hypothetical protein